VVMPLLEGRVLSTVLAGEQLSWQPVVTMTAQVASALAAAHARGIVHRDVSPYNIMLTTSGAQLLDFGISALTGDPEREDADLLGTAAYVAPERLVHADVTTAIDVYSLGVVLYQALCGHLPWRTGSTAELLRAHHRLPPAPLPSIADLPPEVAELCHQCLDKEPERRPTSEQLAVRLAEIAGVPVPELAETNGDNDVASAGHTAFLPSAVSEESDSGDGRPTATVLLTSRRRRLALTVAAIAVPTAALLAMAWGGPDQRPPTPTSCQVTYQQTNGTANEFAAEVTVHNASKAALSGWDLRFGWPGDQNVVAAGDGTWRQDGRQVTLQPARDRAVLNSGQTYRFALSGRYRQINAMPATFAVSGTPCTSTVLAPSATTPPLHVDEPDSPNKGKGKGKGKNGPGGSR